jgi:hypothetical protein
VVLLRSVAVSLTLLSAVACSDDNPPAAPTPTPTPPPLVLLQLRSLSPAAGSVLPHGQTLHFDARLGYDLGTAASGRVSGTAIALSPGGAPVFIGDLPTTSAPAPRGDVHLMFDFFFRTDAAGRPLHLDFVLLLDDATTPVAQLNFVYTIAP